MTGIGLATAPERWLEAYPPMGRPQLLWPFGAEVDGVWWVFATNGHLMIAERERSGWALEPIQPDPHGVVGDCLTGTGEAAGQMDRSVLAQALGAPSEECSGCEGHGKVERDCNCPGCAPMAGEWGECLLCDGAGWVAGIRFGWVGGYAFNFALVAQVVEFLPEGLVTLSAAAVTDCDGGKLYIEAGPVRALVLGVNERALSPDAPRILPPVAT